MLKSLRYDPDRPIDREEWLAVDEQERIEAVYQYHRRMKIRLPNGEAHAIIHAIVENQVALGEKFAAESVLLRLIGEGLERHEAIHALGSVLAQHMFSTLKEGSRGGGFDNAAYIRDLESLSADSWRTNPRQA